MQNSRDPHAALLVAMGVKKRPDEQQRRGIGNGTNGGASGAGNGISVPPSVKSMMMSGGNSNASSSLDSARVTSPGRDGALGPRSGISAASGATKMSEDDAGYLPPENKCGACVHYDKTTGGCDAVEQSAPYDADAGCRVAFESARTGEEENAGFGAEPDTDGAMSALGGMPGMRG